MALKPPVEVPQGAIRLNTDSQKLEFFAQDQWWQMATYNNNLNGGARCVIAGGYGGSPSPAQTNDIQYFTIPIGGNTTDFGDLTGTRQFPGGLSNGTRGVVAGGLNPSFNTTADYLTLASTGNAVLWGSSLDFHYTSGSHSNSTRGLVFGSYNTHPSYAISYVTISSIGTANDFGDLTAGNGTYISGSGSPTRALRFGGSSPTIINTIEYMQIATTGDSIDFGDLQTPLYRTASLSSTTRALLSAGESPSSDGLKTIEYVTIATTGNSIDFGERGTGGQHPNGTSDCVRGVWAGLQNDGAPWVAINVMDYVNIATQGDGVDFGDLTFPKFGHANLSTSHGGL